MHENFFGEGLWEIYEFVIQILWERDILGLLLTK